MPNTIPEKLRTLEDKLYACRYAQALMGYDEATAARPTATWRSCCSTTAAAT